MAVMTRRTSKMAAAGIPIVPGFFQHALDPVQAELDERVKAAVEGIMRIPLHLLTHAQLTLLINRYQLMIDKGDKNSAAVIKITAWRDRALQWQEINPAGATVFPKAVDNRQAPAAGKVEIRLRK